MSHKRISKYKNITWSVSCQMWRAQISVKSVTYLDAYYSSESEAVKSLDKTILRHQIDQKKHPLQSGKFTPVNSTNSR